ncbi:DUF4145 domain-containing protein [bacterium]|nr:DUF4145 domain-containing protein [bacterium]
MKCPHCGTDIVMFENWGEKGRLQLVCNPGPLPVHHDLRSGTCPKCKGFILELTIGTKDSSEKHVIWPRHYYREPCPTEVPEEVAADYNEACAVIDISPTAAAALARRCMQLILVNEAGAPEGKNLKKQIEVVVNDQNAPEHVKSDLDDLREIGNFSAHANEDISGQVMRAEPDEAEWTLQTLRTLFEYYYVGPAQSKARRAALKVKLTKKAK